jgi:NADPH-dependent curcumin reductase CurA
MVQNKGFILAARPKEAAEPENFKLFETSIGAPGPGEVLVKHHFLSLDPYMRGRMNAGKSYAAPQVIGCVMIGGTAGVVLASQNPGFAVGDFVVGMGGWQLYSLCDGTALRKIKPSELPLQAYLGPLGMPGITAWYVVNHILQPKAGETMVVSAATGAVGSVAGQLLHRAGARVIGIAGGANKCAFATQELGYAHCLDHRAESFEALYEEVLDEGIDGVFENVGGKPIELAMQHLKPFARIAICGLVASGYDGSTPTPLPDLQAVLVARAKIQGFLITDHLDLWPKALAELEALALKGELRWTETVADGLEAAPEAFFGMLQGKNFGKQLVRLVE